MIRNEAVLVNRLRNLGCEQVSAFALQITKDPPGFAYQFVPHTLEGERLLKLPVAERISVFAEMCQSIEALHAIGVCHGDLKPSAFRLTEENAVRLVDLNGVDSKAPRSEQSLLVSVSYSAVEAVDRFWTTLKYMAPEQEQGRATSPQVDVYQLGHLLHIVLTGEELTRGLSPELAGDARQFESVIMKAVRRNPSERYQTVSELREAALAAVAGNLNVNHRGPISGKNLAQAVARIGHQRVLDLQTSDGATLTLNSKGSMAAIRYQSELCLYNLEDGKKTCHLNSVTTDLTVPIKENWGSYADSSYLRRIPFGGSYSSTYFELPTAQGTEKKLTPLRAIGRLIRDGETSGLHTDLPVQIPQQAVAISPNGEFLLLTSKVGSSVYRISGGEIKHTCDITISSESERTRDSIADSALGESIFSYSGQFLAVVHQDLKKLLLIDVLNRRSYSIAMPIGEQSPRLCFSQDESRLLALEPRGAHPIAYTFSTKDGASIASFPVHATNPHVSFGLQPEQILYGGQEGILKLVSLSGLTGSNVMPTTIESSSIGEAIRGIQIPYGGNSLALLCGDGLRVAVIS
jgi:serine/threonine protein kinase